MLTVIKKTVNVRIFNEKKLFRYYFSFNYVDRIGCFSRTLMSKYCEISEDFHSRYLVDNINMLLIRLCYVL